MGDILARANCFGATNGRGYGRYWLCEGRVAREYVDIRRKY